MLMPDDILDAAQKTINNAANTADGAVPAPQTPSSTAPIDLPSEPAPDPITPLQTPSSTEPTPISPPSENLQTAQPVSEPLSEEADKLVGSLLEPNNPEPQVVVPPTEKKPLKPSKKSPPKGVILALLAILLVALPVGVYFISQQNEKIAEIRSKAASFTYAGCKSGPTYECCINDPGSCGGNPSKCHCIGGDACTGTTCDDAIETQCKDQGRSYCDNYQGFGKTCCVPGYVCCNTLYSGEAGCCPGSNGDDDNGGDDDTTKPPSCVVLRIYKNNNIVNPANLKPGDQVVLAVRGNKVSTKARFRINGAAWIQTTTLNPTTKEWNKNYTIPTGVSDFVIEGEVMIQGAWY